MPIIGIFLHRSFTYVACVLATLSVGYAICCSFDLRPMTTPAIKPLLLPSGKG